MKKITLFVIAMILASQALAKKPIEGDVTIYRLEVHSKQLNSSIGLIPKASAARVYEIHPKLGLCFYVVGGSVPIKVRCKKLIADVEVKEALEKEGVLDKFE